MTRQSRLILLLAPWLFACPLIASAQQDETTLPPQAETGSTAEEAPVDQEVEINEDNYRQFMELKDSLQQRNVQPENSYQSQARLQKLDRLPEESQKHLRNQLREIIVQGGPWQPGDEEAEYPYVPSEMAANNAGLRRQEAEAWGELVDNYHAREAEIYANSARSDAAAAASLSGATGAGSGEMSAGSTGQAAASQPSGSLDSARQADAADSYSPNAANDPGATSAQGVSQNAMEYLRQSGNLSADTSANASPTNATAQTQTNSAQDIGDDTGQAQDIQLGETESSQATTVASTTVAQDEADSQETDGVSQNALEYLTGESNATDPGAADTLTIEELVNARGLRIELGAGDSETSNDEEKDTPPDKDGDG